MRLIDDEEEEEKDDHMLPLIGIAAKTKQHNTLECGEHAIYCDPICSKNVVVDAGFPTPMATDDPPPPPMP